MTEAVESPGDVLGMARDLLSRPNPATAGLWPRAAALLGRQTLEMTLKRYWSGAAAGVEECSGRAQIICLPSYLGDRDLAVWIGHAWSALSRACHHHPYEHRSDGRRARTIAGGSRSSDCHD